MNSGDMISAAGLLGCIMALIKLVEKLVDKKLGNGAPKPVQIDINQGELANSLGQMVECMASTTQTLERINDKIDDVHEKTTRIETVASVIGDRVKDVQDIGHRTHNAMQKEQGEKKARADEREKVLRELSQSGTNSTA